MEWFQLQFGMVKEQRRWLRVMKSATRNLTLLRNMSLILLGMICVCKICLWVLSSIFEYRLTRYAESLLASYFYIPIFLCATIVMFLAMKQVGKQSFNKRDILFLWPLIYVILVLIRLLMH